MAKVINQNDINDIIASIENTHRIEHMIINHMASVLKSIKKLDAKKYITCMKQIIQGETDILTDISKMTEIIPSTKKIDTLVNFNKNYIKPIVDSLVGIMEELSRFGIWTQLKVRWGARSIVRTIETVVDSLTSLKIAPHKLIKVVTQVLKMQILIKLISGIIDDIDNTIHISIFTRLRLGLKVKMLTKVIEDFAWRLTLLEDLFKSTTFRSKRMIKEIMNMAGIIVVISYLINVVNSISILSLMLFRSRVILLKRAIKLLPHLLNTIAEIRIPRVSSSFVKLYTMAVYVHALCGFMGSLVLASVLMIPFILVSPFIMIAFWTTGKVIKIIGNIMFGIARDPKLWLGLIMLLSIISLLLLISYMILTIAEQAKLIIPSFFNILKFFGLLIAIVAIISVIGLLIVTIIGPILLAIAGIGTMLLMVGMIFLLALALSTLQHIVLDKKRIATNVSTVMDTARYIINTIFNTVMDVGGSKDRNQPWFAKVISFIGGGIGSLLSAILGVYIVALTLVSVVLITVIATCLRLLQNLNLNKEKIKSNVETVLTTVRDIINQLFYAEDVNNTPTKKGFTRTILETLGSGPILNIVDAALAIAFLGTSIISILMIKFLARSLHQIGNIPFDHETIASKIKAIIDAARTVIAAIVQPDDSNPQEAKGFFRKLLKVVLPSNLVVAIDGLMAIGFLAVATTAVGMLGQLANNLTSIIKLPSMDGIKEKVNLVISTSHMVIDTIFNTSINNIGKIVKKSKDIESYFGVVRGAVSGFESIINELNRTKNINMSDPKKFEEITNTVTTMINNIVDGVKVDDTQFDRRCTQISKLQKLIKDFGNITKADIQRINAASDKYIELMDKIGNTKLENLQTAANIFEQMAKFSKSISGDFEGLADTLNDKIAPLMEELKEMLDGVQKKVEKSGSDISASVFASKSNKLNPSEMANQTAREMPNSSKAEREQETRRRMEAQARQQNSEIVSKLVELIELFEDGRARVKPVM